jgi:hypothetical protein
MLTKNSIIIGIDNGTTGTIGILYPPSIPALPIFSKIPSKSEQSYTKTKKNITRIDVNSLRTIFTCVLGSSVELSTPSVHVVMERPLVNPKMFAASMSAMRALEAVLTTVESFGFSYRYIDSKEWQKALLPAGTVGPNLKKASANRGKREFPQFAKEIDKHGDADGLLIALYEYNRINGIE